MKLIICTKIKNQMKKHKRLKKQVGRDPKVALTNAGVRIAIILDINCLVTLRIFIKTIEMRLLKNHLITEMGNHLKMKQETRIL